MSSRNVVQVEAAQSAYSIVIGSSLGSEIAQSRRDLEADGARLAVVTDSNVRGALTPLIDEALAGLPIFEVPSGEASKSLENFSKIQDFLAEEGLDRGGVLVALGGGVVGDLAGFAAAAYLRGIRFIQIPTTLLAMVDSSVGGKTGVNISAGKNLVGAFHQPILVAADMASLDSLPPREFAAGMAEVIKYGLLADLELFEMLEANPLTESSDSRLPAVVQRCCQIKADVVKADEKETASSGGRALLNLGHTFAHAIENAAGYGDYLHGEAVGIGMVAAAELSEALGLIDADAVARVEKVVSNHRLPVALAAPLEIDRLRTAMMKDKKVKSGAIRFIVMESLGSAVTRGGIEWEHVERVWRRRGAVG